MKQSNTLVTHNTKQRILTAAIALSVVVLAVLLLPVGWFAVLLASAVLVASFEWITMMRRGIGSIACAGYVGLTGAMLWLLWDQDFAGFDAVLLLALAWWVGALILIVRYERGHAPKLLSSGITSVIIGWLLLLPGWVALIQLHQKTKSGDFDILLLLAVVWLADISAYAVGRLLGRRRLVPRTSPNKTLEGLCGALVAVLALISGVAVVRDYALLEWLASCALWLPVVLFSVLGDLSVSLCKRQVGVKDSGTFFAGHGGMLDRIDSLCAALPLYIISVGVFRL